MKGDDGGKDAPPTAAPGAAEPWASNALAVEARSKGADAKRMNASIDYFASRPMATQAGLSRAHVLALRLYTTPVARRLNRHLHNGCSPSQPHPYPAMAILLIDAFWRLRAAAVEMRASARQKAAEAAELARKSRDSADDDDDEKAKFAARAAEAAAARDALHNFEFWRGVSDVAPGEIKERGVSELGFVSCCLVKPHAQSDALEAYASLQATTCATGTSPSDWGGEADDHEQELMLTLHPSNPFVIAARQGAEGEPQLDAGCCKEAKEVPARAVRKVAARKPRAAAGAGVTDAGALDTSAPEQRQKEELPVLMFKLLTTEETCPVDLSFLTAFPTRAEYFYPPGLYWEQRKESVEFWDHGNDGERLDCKCIEVVPHLTRPLGIGKGRSKEVVSK